MRKLFLLCAVVIALVGAAFVYDVFLISPKQQAVPIEITIASGSSVSSIAAQLQQSHLITHPIFFKWFVAWTHTGNTLQAGTFSFLPNTSIATLVLVLSNPQSTEVQVTLPEGFTASQMKAKVVSVLPELDQSLWDHYASGKSLEDFSEQILAGIPVRSGLEGYLFPDTYRFAKSADAKEVIGKMLVTLEVRFAQNNESIPTNLKFSNGMTLHEVLTMASIVEKEVQTPEDMKHVAGLLFNRMRIGMPLQVDSTLTYVTQKTSADLTTADLKLASPYNSYTHKGLPPGPICNPGMNAILAVLHPSASDDFYFLTTRDGKTIYAKTHDQHVLNKQKYLK